MIGLRSVRGSPAASRRNRHRPPQRRRYRRSVPELPEVETIRRGLEPRLTARRVADAGSHPSLKFSAAVEAIGRTIVAVGRRGKYLQLSLDDRRDLVIHLGMTGQLRLQPLDDDPDPYDRAWWDLDDGHRLALRDVRRFGRVAVLGEDRSALPTLATLGPEPFDPAFTPETLWQDLRRSRVRLKTQLLSQRVVAGIGNIYADEALWRAGLHPARRQVSRVAAARLHEAIVAVLTDGVNHGGTTLRDYRTAEGATGQNQHHLHCYGRPGLPCHRCGTALRRSVLDGRSTTWCPQCQRR